MSMNIPEIPSLRQEGVERDLEEIIALIDERDRKIFQILAEKDAQIKTFEAIVKSVSTKQPAKDDVDESKFKTDGENQADLLKSLESRDKLLEEIKRAHGEAVDKLQHEIKKLEIQLQFAKEENKSLKDSKNGAMIELKAKLKRLEDENKTLQNRVSKSNNKKLASDKLCENCAEMARKMAELEEYVEKLMDGVVEEELTDDSYVHDVVSLAHNMQAFDKKLQNWMKIKMMKQRPFTSSFNDYENIPDDGIGILKRHFHKMAKENKLLLRDCERLNSRMAKHRKLRDQFARLRKAHEQDQQNIENLTTELNNHAETLKLNQKTIKELEKLRQEKFNRMASAENKSLMLEKRLKKQLEANAALEKHNKELRAQTRSLFSRCNHLKDNVKEVLNDRVSDELPEDRYPHNRRARSLSPKREPDVDFEEDPTVRYKRLIRAKTPQPRRQRSKSCIYNKPRSSQTALSLGNKLRSLRKEANSLRLARDYAAKSATENKDQVKKLEAELGDSKKQLKNLKLREKGFYNDFETMRSKNEQLQKGLDELRARCEKMIAEGHTPYEWKVMEEKLKKQVTLCSDQLATIKTLRKETEDLNNSVQALQERATHAEHDNQQKRTLIESYKERAKSAQQTVIDLESAQEANIAEKIEALEEAKRLRVQNQSLKTQISVASQGKRDADEKTQEMTDMVAMLRDNLQNNEKIIRELQTSLSNLQQQERNQRERGIHQQEQIQQLLDAQKNIHSVKENQLQRILDGLEEELSTSLRRNKEFQNAIETVVSKLSMNMENGHQDESTALQHAKQVASSILNLSVSDIEDILNDAQESRGLTITPHLDYWTKQLKSVLTKNHFSQQLSSLLLDLANQTYGRD